MSSLVDDGRAYMLSVRGFHFCEKAGLFDCLYQKQFDAHVDTTSWSYRAEVLRYAVTAFGKLNRWLQDAEKSPYLYGRRYDFLVDTIRFVETGKRSLEVQSWLELLEDNVLGDRTASVNRNTVPRPKAFRTETFLAQWCAQPKGFQDMLCSLNVLFGSAKQHVEPASPFERLSARPF